MAVTKVVMPKLSEAMETGKIIKWLKKEGDRVEGGDILAEVETDKADVEMEAFGAGVLRKILVPAGGQVPVGSLIAVVAEPGDDIAALLAQAPPAPASNPPAAPGAMAETGSPAAPPPAAIGSPAASAQSRPPGLPTPAPTVPLKVAASAPTAPAAPTAPPQPPAAPRTLPQRPAAAVLGAGPSAPQSARVKASPLARKIAAQWGVDLSHVQGSGPGGRIIRRDVEAAASAVQSDAPAAVGAEFEDLPMSPIRATIARRMPLSKAPVPHFYVSSEVAMDRAWALREELNALEGQPKISLNDFIVRACGLALIEHPGVNASFQGETIRVFHRAHIGVAVALPDGLITPVLRDCQAKSLTQVAVEARDLAERARGRKLKVSEMSGATFSISNLGMFDVTEFSAIINPPEGAILAVGAVRRLPVVDASGALGVGRRMMLTLSCDHRVMDGAMGARFLQDLRRLLEEPLRLLV
jgi:pyruvate dehydrogenase E2 component (dihydrolipoyllysine-residue acetyltransferase)